MVFGKMTNLAVAIAAAAVLALGVSSCGDGEKEGEKEIAVGAVAPLSGSLASTGLGMKNGFELAVKEINASSPPAGRKIRLPAAPEAETSLPETASISWRSPAWKTCIFFPFLNIPTVSLLFSRRME